VLFSQSQDFIPGITFKDVQRFEERNKNVFFNSEGNLRQTQRDLACAQMKFHKHMRDLYILKRISSSIIFFIHSVIFFILIFIENPVKTLFVVEAYFRYNVS
jgi:hypothetical protein